MLPPTTTTTRKAPALPGPCHGEDRTNFLISNTGELTFKMVPDFETPMDDDRDNIYLITLAASDGTHTDTMPVTITVTDVNEAPAFPATENGVQHHPREHGSWATHRHTSDGQRPGRRP